MEMEKSLVEGPPQVSSQHRGIRGSDKEDIEAYIYPFKGKFQDCSWGHWEINELKRVRQEDHKFQASLYYTFKKSQFPKASAVA